MGVFDFFKTLLAWIGKQFTKLPADIKQLVHISVDVVENFKAFIDSPVADLITALIPGDADDQIKKRLRSILPAILEQMKKADNKDYTWSDFHKMAVDIANALADGKLTKAQSIYSVQYYWDEYYNTKS